ncbi:MAG: DUF2877 domain-containing protein [Nocardioides sp.]
MSAPSFHQRPVEPLPVSAPPRVRDLLTSTPDGPVPIVHRGPLAAYVEVDGRCVGLVAAGAAQVPCALRSRLPDLGTLPLRSAQLTGGVLHLDGRPLVVGRSVDVRAPRLAPGAILGRRVSSTGARIDADAVPGLVGCGEGLTPLGDDVLCGWLALHRAAGVPTPDVDRAVRAHLGRTTLLSATLLDSALHGEVLPELGSWLSGLGTAAEDDRATALLRIGATSGAGLLAGARLALDHLLTEGALAA